MSSTAPITSVAPQSLPEGLAFLAPGAELAAVLGSVDRSRLAPADVLEVLAARQRLVSHYQAQLLADLYEAGRLTYAEGAGPLDRKAGLDRFSADEASFTLWWSVETTQSHQVLAEQLLGRLPAVYAALRAGRIDLARAWAFHSALLPVDDDAAAVIVDRLVERAATWTVSNLSRRLAYWVHKLDPDAARRRQQASVAGRRVYARLDEAGTASLGGCHLPPDRAAAAFDRVDAMARAARADGDPRTLNQLRADTYLDLLSGIAFQTRPSRDPLTHAADATHPAVDDEAHHHATPDGDSDGGGPARVVADVEWLSWVGFTDAAGRPFTTTPDAWPPGPPRPGLARPGLPGPGLPGPGLARSGLARSGGGLTGGGWVDREWRPGPHPAPVSVAVAAGVDPGWAAAFTGATLCSCGGLRPPVRGGVHIQVKLSTLMCVDDDPALIPGWGPVIADIARQVAHEQETRPPWFWDVTDRRGNLLHHGHTRRRPTPTERAFVKARDRTCRAPGCGKPALHCDLDHRTLYTQGGPSHRGGLCSLCPHHHALRHEHGYVFHQIHMGTYLMESPSGRRWLITPDGDLILTAEDLDPGPPPGYVAAILGHDDTDDEDDG